MNRTTIFAALACALLFSMLGCGATNNLQSIQLKATLINGVATSGQSGTVTLSGNGGTIQLAAIGTYSNGKTVTLGGGGLVYTAVVDAQYSSNGAGGILLPPCQAPSCPAPSSPPYTSGTLEYNQTGLVTAVEPAECTWVNSAVDPSTTPAWSYVGDYVITAAFKGVTSQPFYVPIGSAAGVVSDSNTTGACGPAS
ncbi:MAG TPA: hypothetical protein VK828_01370 [Terriglobales bacterium]|nr:hypothetical protein [Terriglobales bacterium]